MIAVVQKTIGIRIDMTIFIFLKKLITAISKIGRGNAKPGSPFPDETIPIPNKKE